ncbi:LLM class F420-dependent oxidoreductase [Longimycelium tulufanense]|uniref:LLM class F420-dependent oxidoreductase n=1 Tax=Longimycelium tulufanense TaxID=907463 RepID=A0A8J3CD37_9PSEU|nr:LLM class F420-dependent oxidoreductase [Longimycelium tulufanense]GGM50239.1 LLM class F420-dependent oxidoreductase [Longimycelium tulufanense]
MTEPRWGLTLPLVGVPLADHRDLVRELPALGWTDVWTAETAGTDAFTPLALAAEWEPRLRLGTAIVPAQTRGPGLLAMSAATLAELAPGRFVLGIGASSPVIVTNWNAVPFDRPFQRVRDALRFLRATFAGTKVDEQYETFAVRRFRLERVPATPPRIVLAALRPGMLRLAAREADGAITNWLSAADVPKVRAALGDGPELVARVFVCPTENADLARTVGRHLITSYLTVPAYAEFHRWLGRGKALREMWERWAAGDRHGAAAAVPEEVVDDLLVHGDPVSCRRRVREYAESGVDTPVVMIVPADTDQFHAVRALSPDGAPSTWHPATGGELAGR